MPGAGPAIGAVISSARCHAVAVEDPGGNPPPLALNLGVVQTKGGAKTS
jgi:hypothetical protein